MQNMWRHVHLIWADKIALWIVLLGLGVAAVSWALVAVAAGTQGADHVFATWGTDSIVFAIEVAIVLWLALRAIDFLAKGATFAFFKHLAARHEAAPPKGPTPPSPLIGAH